MLLKSNIWAYYINPDKYSHRKEAIETMVNSLNLKGSTRIAFNKTLPDRANTMTAAHIYTIEQAINDNNFPFILFEDDAAILTPLPDTFSIPEEAKLIYLGGSTYDCIKCNKPMSITEYNDEYYRVYNMLSFHSVLIPNKECAEWLIKVLNNALNNSIYNDVNIALQSDKNVFLVPKGGNYFYQNDYTAKVTKFLWKNIVK